MRVDALCLHLLSMQLQIVFLGAPGPLLDAVVRRHSTNTAADTCCFRGVAPTIPHKSDVLLVDQSGLPTLQMTGGPADLEGPGGQLNGYALHPLIIVEGCHVRRRLGSIWIGRGGWRMALLAQEVMVAQHLDDEVGRCLRPLQHGFVTAAAS